MPEKPDYSEWLTPERLCREEELWAQCRYYADFAAGITQMCADHPITSVVEFGCGTGWVPTLLPPELVYLGVDQNLECLTWARTKNPGPNRDWMQVDIRDFPTRNFQADLGCAFSVLKHFGLSEWDAVVSKILGSVTYGLFTMPIGTEDVDDGIEFPHVWVSPERLEAAVSKAGHQVLWSRLQRTTETMVATERVS